MNHHESHLQPDGTTFPPLSPDPPPPPGYVDPFAELEVAEPEPAVEATDEATDEADDEATHEADGDTPGGT